jgi:hypothetical protein
MASTVTSFSAIQRPAKRAGKHHAWLLTMEIMVSGGVLNTRQPKPKAPSEAAMAKGRPLGRRQRWTLEQLLTAPYCLRLGMRRTLLQRRLVRLDQRGFRCSEHGSVRFVEITEKGRRAIGKTWDRAPAKPTRRRRAK